MLYRTETCCTMTEFIDSTQQIRWECSVCKAALKDAAMWAQHCPVCNLPIEERIESRVDSSSPIIESARTAANLLMVATYANPIEQRNALVRVLLEFYDAGRAASEHDEEFETLLQRATTFIKAAKEGADLSESSTATLLLDDIRKVLNHER